MESSKVLTTRVSVYSTHAAKVYISANITGKKSFKSIDISNQVKKALLDAYNYQNSNINRPVRQSDLYALIDNQSMVDYLNPNSQIIEEILSEPALNITYFKMISFDTVDPEDDYENCYIQTVLEGSQAFYMVYATKDVSGSPLYTGQYGKPLNISLTRSTFSITINLPVDNANYENGTIYQLTTQPMGSEGRLVDLIPHNYNIPIINSDNITLVINEVV